MIVLAIVPQAAIIRQLMSESLQLIIIINYSILSCY